VDALNLAQVLRRRWLLTVALLAVLTLALLVLVRYAPTEYQSTGVGLVIRQDQELVDDSGRRDNPFAGIDNSLGATGTLLVTVVTSPAVQQELAEAGLQGEVEVTNAGSSFDPESPFVSVTATANDPGQAAADVELVLARADQELSDRQDAVSGPLVERLALLVVVPPPDGQLTRAGLLRAVALAGAAGLVLVLILVVAADRLMLARRGRERPRDQGPARVDEAPWERPSAAMRSTSSSRPIR